jgi:ribonuclease G
MSKELIVSATRHETRVAVLEDDQVVEIFYQREKEYSLAGSIHKGRVTRVLPGMQSAFVDIGLERDAFLYVSDFFEDNDEYDKIVTGVEEKVFKLERAPAALPGEEAVTAVNGTESALTAEEPRSEQRAAPMQAPEVAERGGVERSGGGRERSGERGGDRGGDRNRGGRGRRRGRRGPGGPGGSSVGGGLPESKYFSPRQQRPMETAEERPERTFAVDEAASSEPVEDLIILPGESLAKYGSGESRPELADEPELFLVAEPAAPEIAEITAIEREELAEVFIVAEYIAEPETATEAPVADGVHELEAEEEAEVEAEAIAEAVAEEIAEASDDIDSEDGEPEAENGNEDADGESSEVEEDLGPEPARIPTSLTAALREQNPRYQHRVSRRMRRKMRSGPPGEQGAPVVREAGNSEPQSEPRETREARAPREREPREREPREQREPREREPREQRQPREPRETRESREREDRPRPPMPSISDLLHEGQEIVVQIAKEPLGQKGARITSHVALPGRFLVYMPSVDHIGVSRKIPSDEERLRLKKVLQTHRTGIPGGFIVRTAGDGKSEEELRADMQFLHNLWTDMRQKVEKKPAPQLMHHDLDVVQRILRDQLTSAFKTVWVDNEELYESVLRFVQRFQPALVSRVKLYTRSTPIFDEFGITSELEKALRPKVWLKSGGYIVINQTEALVAIDINTGKYVGKSNRLEDTIVKTNTDAIKEIVRQIRLRDLGGIIVVDFIDMDERKNRAKVMQALEEAMRSDRAPYKILQFNDFGLVAITRKRVKQSLERTLCAPCPYCEGAGYVKSVQTVIGEILIEAHKMAKLVDGSDVMLRVHPEVAKVLKSNQNDFLQEVEETLGKNVMVKSDPLLHQTKFDLA